MRKTLEPFQEAGRDFLASRYHALLADQPGLGKTVQALHGAEQIDAWHNLVICPASVRDHWRQSIREEQISVGGWRVVSYNEATRDARDLGRENWDLLVLDEGHFLKTPESQRTQAVFANNWGIARSAKYKWALTGTPVLNRPREMYPILRTLHKGFAHVPFGEFARRYCDAFFDGYGVNTKGASNLEELSRRLDGFMLRRTKREVYPDRKDPIVSQIPLTLTAQDLAAVIEAEDEIGGREAKLSPTAEAVSQLGDTSRLLRLLGMAKVPRIFGFVTDLLQTVDKVVVFAHHRDVVSALHKKFSLFGMSPVVYQGGMTDGQKAYAIKQFQKPECRVFIGNRQAAGTGINGLQKVCSTCVIAEPSWVPGETEQMIDRLDRIGQENDIVNAYLLYAAGTLDEVVVHVHRRKEAIVERVMQNPLLGEL